MKYNRRAGLAAWAIMLCALSLDTYAELRFNGFASIRATAADSDNGTPPFDRFKGDGDISFKDESLFAIQASADLSEGLTATVQLLAEGTDDFEVEAQWAYLTYELNDTHSVSAGRLINPIFHQSQYEKVGYAHNFARLPKSVYSDFDFSTIEGISLDSTFFVGDLLLETKLTYGNWDGEVFLASAGGDFSTGFKDILSANLVLSGDWWKVFAGGFVADFEGGELDSVFVGITEAVLAAQGIDGLAATGATSAEIADFTDAVGVDGNTGTYLFAGFSLDKNNILVDFEFVDYGAEDTMIADAQGWFVALGYRFGQHLVSLHQETLEETEVSEFLDGVTNPLLFAAGSFGAGILANTDIDATGITWRYDFHPSAALKVDYLAGENEDQDIGDYSIWSIGVDMVF